MSPAFRLVAVGTCLSILAPLAAAADEAGDVKSKLAEHYAAARKIIDTLPKEAAKGELSQDTAIRTLARACGYADMFPQMEQLAGQLSENQHLITARYPGFHIVHGRWDQAAKLLDQMKQQDQKGLSLAWTLAILQGMPVDVTKTLNLGAKAPIRSQKLLWSSAVRQELADGRLARARGRASQAARKLDKQTLQRVEPDIQTWLDAAKIATGTLKPTEKLQSATSRAALLATLWAARGKIAQAQRAAEALPDDTRRAKAFISIAQAHLEAGNALQASRYLQQAEDMLLSEDQHHMTSALAGRQIAQLRARQGQLKQATDTLDRFEEYFVKAAASARPGDKAKITAQQKTLQQRFAKARLHSRILARQVDAALEQIEKEPALVDAEILTELHETLGKIGMADRVEKILPKIKDPQTKLYYHIQMVLHLSGKAPGER